MSSIEQDFVRFDRENPHVFRTLVDLARRWRATRGNERLGIATLYEVTRWDMAMRTSGDPYKLNNNYRAYYARKIAQECPDLAAMFETRRLRAA